MDTAGFGAFRVEAGGAAEYSHHSGLAARGPMLISSMLILALRAGIWIVKNAIRIDLGF